MIDDRNLELSILAFLTMHDLYEDAPPDANAIERYLLNLSGRDLMRHLERIGGRCVYQQRDIRLMTYPDGECGIHVEPIADMPMPAAFSVN